jgi:hypothetical protein
MDITVDVYEPDGSTHITQLHGATNKSWQDVHKDVGGGQVVIGEEDGDLAAHPTITDFEKIIKFSIDGTAKFAFINEVPLNPPAPQGEAKGRAWTLGGRGVLALMERWFVYPEAALPSIARQRMMGWMSASFDDSSSPWIAATALQKQSAGTPITYYKKTLPDQWPDPNAYWIWSRNTSGGVMPASTCYFRKSFTLAQDTWVRLYVTCENAERTILDGEVVVDNLNADPGTIGWSSAQTVERKLTAGTHQLSVEGVNETLPG